MSQENVSLRKILLFLCLVVVLAAGATAYLLWSRNPASFAAVPVGIAVSPAGVQQTDARRYAVPDLVSEEGFRFQQDVGVLTLRGSKPADIGLQIATDFDSMDPACRGMFATDTDDTNYVSKPRAGSRGVLSKLYYLQEGREGEYEMRIPMRVTHPECQWRLAEIEVVVRNSRTKNSISGARTDGSQFLRWGFFMTEHIQQRMVKPDRELFPEQIDAQCYNSVSHANKDRMVICGAKGWRRNTTFPQTVTEHDQTIVLNLNLHPEMVFREELRRRGEEMPWKKEAGFK